MATLVIATNNSGKAREYREMLAPFGVTVKTLADFPRFAIDECGTSFEENALIKARTAVAELDLPVLADDSGLVVDALNGAPGVHSARYAGDHDDAANNAKLLRELTGVPAAQRTAHFHTTIVALKPDGAKLETSGRMEGQILTQPRGQNGFGYDPLFMPKEFPGRSMAELTPAEKNQISHRGRALRAFMEQFAGWWQA
ncbi:XTP/dITP diphosphatase [Limosilactobacillus oris]|uniref:XTP/dITP diphosphatase n=1 Tax=Limosilactobacillus oris TaxID=1632 RepID=UPI0021B19A40|nr:XTP/dITP diphosphatase [Limosilactobacillus oris]UXC67379.1 XTP/dITP diphosphatase [Limosilactobacillus oris]